MNLQVELILPSEQRSASPVGFRLIGKLIFLVTICGIGGYCGLKVMAITDLRSQVRGAEADWTKFEPRQEKAKQLIMDTTENLGILEEIEGWRKSRPLWNEHLKGLALAVPAPIQLESLSIQHEFQSPKGTSTVRVFSISVSGRCSREHGENAVQAFQQNIRQTPPISELADSVDVPRFGEDPKQKEDRVFQLTCTYKPLKML